MSAPELHLAAATTWLPPLRPVTAAVASGECDAGLAESTDMVSVAVSDGPAGPQMAAWAARDALARTDIPVADIALVLHASAYYQGVDMWAPASYVQHHALGGTAARGAAPAPAMEVGQVSSGGMAALSLARAWLSAPTTRGSAALITTGDRFAAPGFDRWRTDPGTVYGDGGTALVLSTRGGFARLRGLALAGAPELEAWHRAGHDFGLISLDQEPVLDLAGRQKRFLAEFGRGTATARVAVGRRRSIDDALLEAGVERDDVSWFVLPHHGRRRLQVNYLDPLHIDPSTTAWDRARQVGHLGAGDAVCGLEHLMRSGRARPGQLCLLLGVGAGFSWSAAVVQIEQEWV